MQIDDRIGTFEGVAAQSPAFADLMSAVRARIEALHPEATEVAADREGSVWWGVGPKKMSDGYIYIMAHKAHLNLGFFHGASLQDPENRLEGTGKKLRHIKLREAATLDEPAVAALMRAAIAERMGA